MVDMKSFTGALRFLAIVMIVVVVGTVTAPAPAHADALAAIGLVALAAAGLLIVGYLIAANASERRTTDEGTPVVIATAPPVVTTEAP